MKSSLFNQKHKSEKSHHEISQLVHLLLVYTVKIGSILSHDFGNKSLSPQSPLPNSHFMLYCCFPALSHISPDYEVRFMLLLKHVILWVASKDYLPPLQVCCGLQPRLFRNSIASG